jgi:putative DNA primase/helicase
MAWTDRRPLSGIGFVVTNDDRFVGIDLDHCVDPDSGQVEYWAQEIVDQLNTYTEVTPNDTGLRCFLKGKLPLRGRKKDDFECYETSRFLTITGRHVTGTPLTIEDRQSAMDLVHASVFGEQESEQSEQLPPPVNDLDDATIIAKASNAKNAGKFRRLWSGDWRGYESHSQADFALCGMLAFWAGGDLATVDRLFRQSGLMSDKWDSKRGDTTYGGYTISNLSVGVTYRVIATSSNGARNHILPDELPKTETDSIGPLPLTDLGNAERLIARHGNDLRYCWPAKQWHIWDGTRWAPDKTGEIYRRATDTVRNIYGESVAVDDADIRTSIADWAKKCESASRIEQMISLARSRLGVPVEIYELDQDPWVLNVRNGTIDLKSGELREHRREDLITIVSPVVYDPHIRDSTWEGFLDRILPAANLQNFVQRAFGYSITGDCREEVLFFPYGPTQTGKSTLLRAVASALGEYSAVADFGTFLARDKNNTSPRNDIAALAGKRLVISLEVDKDQRLAESTVKQLTGGDPVRARYLYQESFQFIPTFKLWFAANDRPRVRDDDDAIWRRILQIPFDQHIPDKERDNMLKDYLQDPELAGPAVIAWLVQGCLNWQVVGLGVDDATKSLTGDYRDAMDPIRDFLSDYCVIAPAARVRNPDLYKAYEEWAKDNGLKRPLAQRTLTQRLKSRGFEQEAKHGVRTWYGLGLMAHA